MLYAPLFGIVKLTEYDMKKHALEMIVGAGYRSSTLNQFLGQLERVEAGEALVPALVPQESGAVCHIDSHIIAFWTKRDTESVFASARTSSRIFAANWTG